MPAMIDPELLKSYNRTRKTRDRSLICHAPFVSLNFEQNGNATACCYNRKQVLGTYPKDSIMDMWLGDSAQELRKYIKANDLGGGCEMCGQQLQSSNFHGTRARGFDDFAQYKPLAVAGRLKNYFKHGQYLTWSV
jgi:MoaA/NifB/PqqE/SkfB family radical SAM enzyme